MSYKIIVNFGYSTINHWYQKTESGYQHYYCSCEHNLNGDVVKMKISRSPYEIIYPQKPIKKFCEFWK